MLGLVSCVLSCLTAKLENGKSKKKKMQNANNQL